MSDLPSQERTMLAKIKFVAPAVVSSVVSALIAVFVAGPFAVKSLNDVQAEYRKVTAEVQESTKFWTERNKEFRARAADDAKQVGDMYADIKKRQAEDLISRDSVAQQKRLVETSLITAEKSFYAARELFQKFNFLTFDSDNVHVARPLRYKKDYLPLAEQFFDTLVNLQQEIKASSNALAEATAKAAPPWGPEDGKQKGDAAKGAPTPKAGESLAAAEILKLPEPSLRESDVFAGINLKLAIPENTETLSERQRLSSQIEGLLKLYQRDFVENSGVVSPIFTPGEYPNFTTVKERQDFERGKCKMYHEYLVGKHYARQERLRESLIALNQAKLDDPARKLPDPALHVPDWSALTFYPIEYNQAVALEGLLFSSLAQMSTPTWAEDFKALETARQGLQKFFEDHSFRKSDPTYLFAQLGFVEWCAYKSEADMQGWKEIDECSNEFGRCYTKLKSSKSKVFEDAEKPLKYIRAHRCCLAAIMSGYDEQHTQRLQDLEHELKGDDYVLPPVRIVVYICDALRLQRAKSEDWKADLDAANQLLEKCLEQKDGLPLGILLRLHADLKRMGKGSMPVDFNARAAAFKNDVVQNSRAERDYKDLFLSATPSPVTP